MPALKAYVGMDVGTQLSYMGSMAGVTDEGLHLDRTPLTGPYMGALES